MAPTVANDTIMCVGELDLQRASSNSRRSQEVIQCEESLSRFTSLGTPLSVTKMKGSVEKEVFRKLPDLLVRIFSDRLFFRLTTHRRSLQQPVERAPQLRARQNISWRE